MQRYRGLTLLLLAAIAALIVSRPAAVWAQQKPKNATKGQTQLAGGNGEFGTIYSLSGFNFEILSAKYSVDPFVAYNPAQPRKGEKFLILTMAIKNTTTGNNFFNLEGFFTAVDSTGQLYGSADMELASAGSRNFDTNLRPGQGMGQPGLHDPLTVAFEIPGNARIVKVMVNHGRLGRDEKVFRYYVAGATKEEAGEAGDPKNIVGPLPANCADPADKTGAILLDLGKGTMGTYVPSAGFFLRVDKFEYSTDVIYDGHPAPAGKKFAIATATAKGVHTRESMFDVVGGDFPLWAVETTDGDRIKRDGAKKATSDVDADHSFEPGDEYTFRVFFIVDKDAVVKRLVVGCGGSNCWAYDVSNIH